MTRAELLDEIESADAEEIPALAGALVEALFLTIARAQRREDYITVEAAAARALATPDALRSWARRRSCSSWARWVNRKHLIVCEAAFDRWLSSAKGRAARDSARKRAAEQPGNVPQDGDSRLVRPERLRA